MSFHGKRFDIISALPLEIVAECIVPRIMEYDGRQFMLHGRRNYFALCTTWSKRLAVSDDSIHFNLECDRLLSSFDWRRVHAVAPYIKQITVNAGNEEALSNLIRYAQFASLRDFRIIGNGGEDVKDVDHHS